MKRLIRRIERFVITNICLSAAICSGATLAAATVVFVVLFRYFLFPAVVAEAEMQISIAEAAAEKRVKIAEGTTFVRLMAADDSKRKCIEAVMIRGQLVCLQQGGK